MDFTKGDLAKSKLIINHSGFLCHVTYYFYSKYNIGDKYPSFDSFFPRISAVFKWKNLLSYKNFPKTTLGR